MLICRKSSFHALCERFWNDVLLRTACASRGRDGLLRFGWGREQVRIGLLQFLDVHAFSDTLAVFGKLHIISLDMDHESVRINTARFQEFAFDRPRLSFGCMLRIQLIKIWLSRSCRLLCLLEAIDEFFHFSELTLEFLKAVRFALRSTLWLRFWLWLRRSRYRIRCRRWILRCGTRLRFWLWGRLWV
nr:MAG TPA: hypothetical protein [Caudoviricetes sp.]